MLLLAIVAITVALCSKPADSGSGSQEPADTRTRISFVAVGDNLPDEYIGYYADAQLDEPLDETYDYRPIFAHIKPYIEAADLAYMKQETTVGGNVIGPKGYPSFNTTDEMADAVVDMGVDLVASASNHAYDWGLYDALEHSLEVWESKPVAFTGTAVTAEQYYRIPMVERKGVTFALLDYTYGLNWPDDLEISEYAVNLIDKDRIAADVERAREEGADVVLVAMHWGTENLMEADEEQLDLAQFLADLDVDVVLGSHPHVIGPMAWVENSDGSGHKTLVAYSLGNFLSDHETPGPRNELEGMLICDFVVENDGTITIENVKWTPLVNHTNADRWNFAVYALKDYTAELAAENPFLAELDDPLEWFRTTSAEVVGPDFEQDV